MNHEPSELVWEFSNIYFMLLIHIPVRYANLYWKICMLTDTIGSVLLLINYYEQGIIIKAEY